MKTIKDKQVLVAADFAGVALKNAVVAHLEKCGWTCTDIGVKTIDEKGHHCPDTEKIYQFSPVRPYFCSHTALQPEYGRNDNL